MGDSVFFPIKAKDTTKSAFDSVTKRLNKMSGSMQTLNQGAELVGKTFRKLKFATDFFARRAKEFDDLAKSANRLGTTSDQLDRLSHSADLAGASLQDLETIFKRGQRQIFDAASGVASAAEAFDILGIAVRRSDGKIKSVQQVMFEFSDKMDSLGSETEKTALAMEIFGRSGQQMIPFFRLGSEAIKEQLIEAELLGTRYYDMTQKGEEFVDMQVRMKRVTRAWGDSIANETLPFLNRFLEKIVEITEIERNKAVGVDFMRDIMGIVLDEGSADAQLRQMRKMVTTEIKAIQDEFGDLQREPGFLGIFNTSGLTDEESEAVRRLSKSKEQLLELDKRLEVINEQHRKSFEENITVYHKNAAALAALREEGVAYDDIILRGSIGKKLADDLKMDLMTIPEDLKNTFREELPLGIPGLLIPPNTQYSVLRPFFEAFDQELMDAADTWRDVFGGVFADFTVETGNVIDAFEQAWKDAFKALAKQMLSNMIFRGLGMLFGGPLGGVLGGTLLSTLSPGTSTQGSNYAGGSTPRTMGAPQGTNFIFNGLTTTSQSEQVRTTTELAKAKANSRFLSI